MDPIAINLGFLQITWYSILIFIGIVFASFTISLESKKFSINKDFITNLVFWTAIFGIIGARIYYVAFNWDYYSVNTSSIYKIWEGGLAIHGGIIFGIIFILIYTLKYRLKPFRMLDIIAPGVLIAQAVGRWGNFVNKEAYGIETTKEFLEKLKIIPNFVIKNMNINEVFYHPTFYYESLWCFLGFILIIIIRKFYKYLKLGQITSFYFIFYGVGRFFIETLRTDSLMIENFKVAQITSLLLILLGIIILIIKSKGSKFENRYEEVEEVEIRF